MVGLEVPDVRSSTSELENKKLLQLTDSAYAVCRKRPRRECQWLLLIDNDTSCCFCVVKVRLLKA